MEASPEARRSRAVFLCSMGAIALFLGFVPVLLGHVSGALAQWPAWLGILIRTVPLQIAYFCAVLLPSARICPEVPLAEQLDLVIPRNAWRTFGLVSCGVLFLYPLLGTVTFLTGKILELLRIPAEPQMLALLLRNGDSASILVIAATGILLAPAGEELVFRHAVFNHFRRFASPFAAACVSGFLFAAVHFNVLNFPALFLLALFLQFVCCRTGSLLCAIYAHALYNALSVCLLLCFRS